MGDIVVFGAGGRAGRAVTAEARTRGHRVTAVARDPDKYAGIAEDDNVRWVRGDVTEAGTTAALVRGHDAVVHAVSPFSGPEQGFAGLDPLFYVKAADALVEGLAEAGVARLLVVGLFANLEGPDGRLVLDDPAAFPSEIRPFALAHTAGLDRLRARGDAVDWLMLTPPALLEADGVRTGRYRIGGDRVPESPSARLSYADLAVALVDEYEKPTLHRKRVSVFS